METKPEYEVNSTGEIILDTEYQTFREQQAIYDKKSNFTQVPNFLIDDILNLNPYSLKLLLYMLRVTLYTEKGICYMTTATLAENTHMSVGQVTNCKKELIEKGLISISKKPSGRGKDKDVIVIKNIWKLNLELSKKQDFHSWNEHDNSLSEHDNSWNEMNNTESINTDINNIAPKNQGAMPLTKPEQKPEQVQTSGNGHKSQSQADLPPAGRKTAAKRGGDLLDGMLKYAAGETLYARARSKIKEYFRLDIAGRNETERKFLDWAAKQDEQFFIRLDNFRMWWFTQDWRGKQGQCPSMLQIQTLWPQAEVSLPESPYKDYTGIGQGGIK